jgi:hypothetical protein
MVLLGVVVVLEVGVVAVVLIIPVCMVYSLVR